MDSQIKSDWVEALRSGDYKQEQGTLKGDGYCCLGVLCDIVDDREWKDFGTDSHRYHYNGDDGVDVLPKALAEDLGIEGKEPEVRAQGEDGRNYWVELPVINDGMGDWDARSFEEIADLIEEQL